VTGNARRLSPNSNNNSEIAKKTKNMKTTKLIAVAILSANFVNGIDRCA